MAVALHLWLPGAEEKPCVRLRSWLGPVPLVTRCVSVGSGPPCMSGDRVRGDGWTVEAGAKWCRC